MELGNMNEYRPEEKHIMYIVHSTTLTQYIKNIITLFSAPCCPGFPGALNKS